MCIITKITQFLEVHKQLPEISLGTITQKAKPRKDVSHCNCKLLRSAVKNRTQGHVCAPACARAPNRQQTD